MTNITAADANPNVMDNKTTIDRHSGKRYGTNTKQYLTRKGAQRVKN